MLKRVGSKKLGRKASHRKALIVNQLRSLFEIGYITTTTQKAKVLKSNAESLLVKLTDTQAPALVTTRELYKYFGDAKLVKVVSGYLALSNKGVSIIKVGFRPGDNAEVSKVLLMNYPKKSRSAKTREKMNKKVDDQSKKATIEAEGAKSADKKGSFGTKIAQSLKSRFTGSKERTRTRSGL